MDTIGFHRLRTRRSGPNRFVDSHLVVLRTATLAEAYSIVKQVEGDVRREYPRANVTIRVQPCTSEDCSECRIFTTSPACSRLAPCRREEEGKKNTRKPDHALRAVS